MLFSSLAILRAFFGFLSTSCRKIMLELVVSSRERMKRQSIWTELIVLHSPLYVSSVKSLVISSFFLSALPDHIRTFIVLVTNNSPFISSFSRFVILFRNKLENFQILFINILLHIFLICRPPKSSFIF